MLLFLPTDVSLKYEDFISVTKKNGITVSDVDHEIISISREGGFSLITSGGLYLMKGQLKTTINLQGLIFLQQRSPAMFHEAMKRGAIQLLTWCNTGSPRESRKPPIRFGVLRGSSSAFVGSDLVEVFKQSIQPGAIETPEPAMSHSANSKNDDGCLEH